MSNVLYSLLFLKFSKFEMQYLYYLCTKDTKNWGEIQIFMRIK